MNFIYLIITFVLGFVCGGGVIYLAIRKIGGGFVQSIGSMVEEGEFDDAMEEVMGELKDEEDGNEN